MALKIAIPANVTIDGQSVANDIKVTVNGDMLHASIYVHAEDDSTQEVFGVPVQVSAKINKNRADAYDQAKLQLAERSKEFLAKMQENQSKITLFDTIKTDLITEVEKEV